MLGESGKSHQIETPYQDGDLLGYGRIALDLIESLEGICDHELILNIPNEGAITGMAPKDIVEIPVKVSKHKLQPKTIWDVPDHCLGLMKLIKAYEMMTIEAIAELSSEKAVSALTIHPLIADRDLAVKIFDEYQSFHRDTFPIFN
jgi:6-phospho-beta-glucosidase